MSIVDSQKEVQFCLFGSFRVLVNGEEVPFKEATFFTYLKLYLLAGESFLSTSKTRPLWESPKGIRDLLDKGNSRPKAFQGGRHDFTGITGLSLKYREGLGIELQGKGWQADVVAFETAWAQRSTTSNEILLRALQLYGTGVDLQSWKKDSVLIGCKTWVKAQLATLDEHCKDIRQELESRLALAEPMLAATGSDAVFEQPGRWNDEEEIHHETSGSGEYRNELNSENESSAPLRDPLPEEVVTNDDYSEPPPNPQDRPYDPVDEKVVELFVTSGERQVKDEPTENPQPAQTRVGENDLPPPRRTVSALGVVVTATFILMVFAAGYGIASMVNQRTESPMRVAEPPTLSAKPNPPGNVAPLRTDKKPKKDAVTKPVTPEEPRVVDEEPPIVRAPKRDLDFATLFLKDLGQAYSKISEEDVVIGRQLYTHYIHTTNRYFECVPAYKLDGKFTTFTCIVGVADEEEAYFETKNRTVLIEGDGKVLQQVDVQPGNAYPVKLSVKGIKVLIISFRRPVVIAAPKLQNK